VKAVKAKTALTAGLHRLIMLIGVAWILGFGWFAGLPPQPAVDQQTDAIVVPTGGEGRIMRGIMLMQSNQARRMLITGVDPRVTKAALAERQQMPISVINCCVDLGREAVDTRSNATETANWVRQRGYRSIRLVTNDWHMRRARLELSRSLGPRVRIVADALRSEASLGVLFREYNKYLVRRAAAVLRW
jgi:uncharacterized SAM-binding protein YcdF (DUF218 family)